MNRREPEPLKLIGYWYNPYDEHRWPHPRRLRFRWEDNLKSRIVDYLQAGRVCAVYRGWSYCRFWYGRNGHRELTDGVFAWPEGLAHYVAAHDVRLPEEFVQHARSMGFAIPADLKDEDGEPKYDFSFWATWCDREVRPSWRDGVHERFRRFLRRGARRVT